MARGRVAKQPLCGVDDCGNPHYAKGLCNKHYVRLARQGTTADPDWRVPPLERFSQLHEVDASGCWLWVGTRTQRGYGMFDPGLSREGGPKMMSAHRWAYLNFVGPIPDELQLDHLCRVRHCVNPAHLEPVTGRVNRERSPLAPERKTHCPAGHPYDEANTYVYKGRRACRTCAARRRREWQLRHR